MLTPKSAAEHCAKICDGYGEQATFMAAKDIRETKWETGTLTPEEIELARSAIRTHRFMLASALTTTEVDEKKWRTKARKHMSDLASLNDKLDDMAASLPLDTK